MITAYQKKNNIARQYRKQNHQPAIFYFFFYHHHIEGELANFSSFAASVKLAETRH